MGRDRGRVCGSAAWYGFITGVPCCGALLQGQPRARWACRLAALPWFLLALSKGVVQRLSRSQSGPHAALLCMAIHGSPPVRAAPKLCQQLLGCYLLVTIGWPHIPAGVLAVWCIVCYSMACTSWQPRQSSWGPARWRSGHLSRWEGGAAWQSVEAAVALHAAAAAAGLTGLLLLRLAVLAAVPSSRLCHASPAQWLL